MKIKGITEGSTKLKFIINTENHTALVPTDNRVIKLNIEYRYSNLKINNASIILIN